MTRGPDYELEALLSLDGYEFRFTMGYVMKFEARQVKPGRGRPHGVKYSLTCITPRDTAFMVSTTRTGPDLDGNSIIGIRTACARSCVMPIADR